MLIFFSDENEALSTLKVALELKSQGKLDKALRLFQHALALAPKHPEVLNNYGEYLEHSHSDVILADMMYFQVKFKSILYIHFSFKSILIHIVLII